MAVFGQFVLALAFVMSAVGVLSGIKDRLKRTDSGLPATMLHVTLICCTFAIILLGIASLRHDFQIKYVHRHSDTTMPLLYLIASIWGGQSGSLLLWVFLLTLFSTIAMHQYRRQMPETWQWASVVLQFMIWFFLILVVFVEDPFARYPASLAPVEGRGLNPMLRTIEMLFHPPTTYLGFVGFTVPFALFIGAVWSKRLTPAVHSGIRRWMLFSWGMLTIGIMLGAEWAYRELGWGGFWAWDPVENASLFPWLTGTAALHSLILTRRKGMLKKSSFMLVSVTFALCIFATMLTRSGIVASVHAFGKSSLLYFFLAVLAVIATACLATLAAARKELEGAVVSSWKAREGLLAASIIALAGTAAVILWGTMLPVFSELLMGRKLTWTVPSYNLAAAPFGILLLLLMAWCIIREYQPGTRTSRIVLGLAIAAAAAGFAIAVHFIPSSSDFEFSVLNLLLYRIVPPLLSASAAAALIVIFARLIDWIRSGRRPDRRQAGAWLAHLGTVLLFLGFIGTAYVDTKEARVSIGEIISIGDYEISFDSLEHLTEGKTTAAGAQHEVTAILTYSRNGKERGKLSPGMVFYRGSEERPQAEINVVPGLRYDLYAILSGYDETTATVKLMINPLTTWLWIGSVLLMLGTAVAFWPARAEGFMAETSQENS